MKPPGLILLRVCSAKCHKITSKSPGCARQGEDGLEGSFSSHHDRKWDTEGYFQCDRGHHVHLFLAGGVPSLLPTAKAWWGRTPLRGSPPVFGGVWGTAWPLPPVDLVLLLAWPPLWGKYIQYCLSSVSPAGLGSSLTRKKGWEVPQSKLKWPRVSSAGKAGEPKAPQNKQQGRIRTQLWVFISRDRNRPWNRTARQPCLSLLLLTATGVLRKRKHSSLIPPLYLTGQPRTPPGAPR